MHSSLREGIYHQRRFKSKEGRLNRDCKVCGSGVWRQTNIKIKDIVWYPRGIYVVEWGILFYRETRRAGQCRKTLSLMKLVIIRCLCAYVCL